MRYLDPEAVREKGRPYPQKNDAGEILDPNTHLFIPKDTHIIAVLWILETREGRENYRIPERVHGLGPSWAELRKMYWAGMEFAIDVTSPEDLKHVCSGNKYQRMFLYFLYEDLVEEGTGNSSGYPIAKITFAEAEEEGSIDLMPVKEDAPSVQAVPREILSMTHKPRPDEHIYLERRDLSEQQNTPSYVISSFLDVRSRNIKSGAHEIPRIRITEEGSFPSSGLTTRNIDSHDPPPSPESFVVSSEKTAMELLTHFIGFIRFDNDEQDRFIFSSRSGNYGYRAQHIQKELEEKGALDFIRDNQISIHGTPIVDGKQAVAEKNRKGS